MELEEEAAARGAHIIMIPDYESDRAVIAAKGWLQRSKPFTIADMLALLARAVGPADKKTVGPIQTRGPTDDSPPT